MSNIINYNTILNFEVKPYNGQFSVELDKYWRKTDVSLYFVSNDNKLTLMVHEEKILQDIDKFLKKYEHMSGLACLLVYFNNPILRCYQFNDLNRASRNPNWVIPDNWLERFRDYKNPHIWKNTHGIPFTEEMWKDVKYCFSYLKSYQFQHILL